MTDKAKEAARKVFGIEMEGLHPWGALDAALAAYDRERFGEDVVETTAREIYDQWASDLVVRNDQLGRASARRAARAVLRELGIIE